MTPHTFVRYIINIFIYLFTLTGTAGCTASIFRKDIEAHLSEAAEQHNQLFMKEMGGLQREISELKSVVMNARHEITLQVRVDELMGQKVILVITYYFVISHQLNHPVNTTC